jgi:hypothetical protein
MSYAKRLASLTNEFNAPEAVLAELARFKRSSLTITLSGMGLDVTFPTKGEAKYYAASLSEDVWRKGARVVVDERLFFDLG